MARRGSTSNANRLVVATAVVTAYPMTFAGWYKGITLPSVDVEAHTLMAISDTGVNDNFFGLIADDDDDLFKQITNDGSGREDAVSTTAAVVGQWFHVGVVLTSATDRRIYVDGVDEGQNTVSRTPTGLDTTALFVVQLNAGFFSPANADLGECGVWNVGLTANEMTSLFRGKLPNEVRPQALRGYYQLPEYNLGNEADLSGNLNNLTEAGTIGGANHPPVLPYSSRFWKQNGVWLPSPLVKIHQQEMAA